MKRIEHPTRRTFLGSVGTATHHVQRRLSAKHVHECPCIGPPTVGRFAPGIVLNGRVFEITPARGLGL